MMDIVELRMWRCDVTGTDTVREGYECACQGCAAARITQALRIANAERDEAMDTLGRVIMALPTGTRAQGALAGVKALRARVEAAQAALATIKADTARECAGIAEAEARLWDAENGSSAYIASCIIRTRFNLKEGVDAKA